MDIIDKLKKRFSKEKQEGPPSPSNEIALTRGETNKSAIDALALSEGQSQAIRYLENPNTTEAPKKLIDLRELENIEHAKTIELQAKLERKSLKQIAKIDNKNLIAENADAIKEASAVNRERFTKAVNSICDTAVTTIEATGKGVSFVFKILLEAAKEVGSAALGTVKAISEYNDDRTKSKLDKGLY
jgi:hypothetical protein